MGERENKEFITHFTLHIAHYPMAASFATTMGRSSW